MLQGSRFDPDQLSHRPQRARMLLAEETAPRLQHLPLKLPRARAIALSVERQSKELIVVSVSGCSPPNRRRRTSSTCS